MHLVFIMVLFTFHLICFSLTKQNFSACKEFDHFIQWIILAVIQHHHVVYLCTLLQAVHWSSLCWFDKVYSQNSIIWASAWDNQQCGMCDQQSLRSACAYAQSDQSLCKLLKYSMIVNLLSTQHLEFLSLKQGCRGSSESILVKMPHCWKSHVTAHFFFFLPFSCFVLKPFYNCVNSIIWNHSISRKCRHFWLWKKFIMLSLWWLTKDVKYHRGDPLSGKNLLQEKNWK